MTARPRWKSAVPVDDDNAPEWVEEVLTPRELTNSLHLRWILVVERVPVQILGRSATAVAHLAYRYVGGRSAEHRGLEFFPSYVKMADQMKCSTGPVKDGVAELCEEGFLLKESRRTGDGHRKSSNLYTLAWPLRRPTLTLPNWCGAPTQKGAPCSRPAGWRTAHEGEGFCKRHEEHPNEAEVSP